MKTHTQSLLSLIARTHTSSNLNAQLARTLACPSSSSTHSRTHSTHSTRSITTETNQQRGPARPEVERQDDSHEYIVESEFKDYPLPSTSGATFIMTEAAKYSHKTALVCSITGRQYKYGQLLDGIARFGGALQKITEAQQKGNQAHHPTLAILAPNSPEYPIAFFGGMLGGHTVTTINSTYTPHEVATQLQDSGAQVLMVDALLEPVADAALKMLGKEVTVVVNGQSKFGRPNLRHIIEDPNVPFASPVEIPLNSTAILPYSSGTTGKPKGVCLTHSAYCSSLSMFHHPATNAIIPAEGDTQEVMVGLLPFFHIYGMMVTMSSAIMHGCKTVTMPQFDPKEFLGILAKHQVTRLQLVPPLLNFLAYSPAVPSSVLASVRSVLIGAAPVSPASAAMLKEKAQKPIFFQEGFGMTETLCTHITPKDEERLGWCGKVMPHVRAKVVDVETGDLLPPGERGEMCIDSPGLMTGYHNNPEATQESFDSDGWFKTGDVAVYDERGFFSIVDRIKELIKVKGLQVSPSELEDLLLSHEGVADAGVVGVPDAKAGELPRAYVVPKAKGVTQEQLAAFVSSRVAPHKELAGGIEFVEQLPKNSTGKLLRKELKRMAHGE